MASSDFGHIERLPSGSFQVHVYGGKDPLTGREIRHRRTVRTEHEARIVLGRLLEHAAAGRRPDSRVTVGEAISRYLDVTVLDISTRRTYEGYVRRTILPALGSVELRKVRGPVLDTFYTRLRRCGDLACTGRRSPARAVQAPPTELEPSVQEGKLMRLPLLCGMHEFFYPAALAGETLRTGTSYSFLTNTRIWEQVAAYYIDHHDEVAAFVKYQGLGFAIPYMDNSTATSRTSSYG